MARVVRRMSPEGVVLVAHMGFGGGWVSVIAELKRRNVFRVAALYLVAAWVLLQVGDLLFGLLGLPTSTNKLLFAALVLGFVPALIFSWVYELTPEGLKREHEIERNASITVCPLCSDTSRSAELPPNRTATGAARSASRLMAEPPLQNS